MAETPRDTAPSAGWMEGREHVLPIRIYYEDTDFTGVVYHGNYLRYFERGRSDFLRVVGVGHSALLEQSAAFTVVKMVLEFRRPARIDDALLVRTSIDRAKGPRLYFNQNIFRGRTCSARPRWRPPASTGAGAEESRRRNWSRP